jgi:hypothetical protein
MLVAAFWSGAFSPSVFWHAANAGNVATKTISRKAPPRAEDLNGWIILKK